MKKIAKLLLFVTFATLLLSALAFSVGAEGNEGWVVGDDGKEYYYDSNGEKVTGVKKIGSFLYEFHSTEGYYMGFYDGHTNVGNAKDTASEQAAYEGALAALGAENIFGYYTFDSDELFNYTNNAAVSTGIFGGEWSEDNKTDINAVYVSNVSGVFTPVSKSDQKIQAVLRASSFEIVNSVNGRALLMKGSRNTSLTTSTHSYLNVFMTNKHPSRTLDSGDECGVDLVVEAEYMLESDFEGARNLFAFIDRGYNGGSGNQMPDIMAVNKDGGVYPISDSSKFVCVLNRNEFTRISLAMHFETNTMDIYINGLLVAENVTLFKSASIDSTLFRLDEVRTAQLYAGEGQMYVDNVAIYAASEPVMTVGEEYGRADGAYLEGSVLRYYSDNFVCYGNKKLYGTYSYTAEDGSTVSVSFDGESFNFGDSKGDGSARFGDVMTVIVDGKTVSDDRVVGNVFTAPEKADGSNGKLVGWRITDGGTEKLVAPGELYRMNGSAVCEAYFMDFALLDGASMRTTAGSSGLRFMAKIGREQYEELIAAGAEIKAHMLIVPTYYLESTYGYCTIEALESVGLTKRIDITAADWYETTGNYYYYVGSVGNILEENFTLEYSARAYLEITYPDGSTHLVYSDYDEEKNSRSVYKVAHAAYNDRTTLTGQSGYGNLIVYKDINTYSPYNTAKLAVIKGYADSVITVSAGHEKIDVAGAFYDAYYSVSSTSNGDGTQSVTVTPMTAGGLSAAKGVVLNGKLLAEGEYTLGDNCVFNVDVGGVSIESLNPEAEAANIWKLLDVSNEYGQFKISHSYSICGHFLSQGGKNTNSTYIHPSQNDSISAKWVYCKNGTDYSDAATDTTTCGASLRLTAASGSTSGDFSAIYDSETKYYYYDLSVFEAMDFYVYLDSPDDKTRTVQINFMSDNSSTDGADYYGRKLTLYPGWNYVSLKRSDFGGHRTPLGWDKINSVQFTYTGWSQKNDSLVAYFSDINIYDSARFVNVFTDDVAQNASIFSIGGYYSAIDGKKVVASADTNATAFEENGITYLPIAPLAFVKGSDAVYYPTEKLFTFTYGGVKYVFNADSKTYKIGTESATLSAPVIEKSGALFAPMEDLKRIFGYSQSYVDRMGLVVLSNTVDILDAEADYSKIYGMIEELIYVRPNGEQMMEDLEAHSGGEHPYLLLNEEDFDQLRYYLKVEPTLRKYVASLESTYGVGTNNFNAATNTYRLPDGQRLLSVSRDVMNKVIAWALFYNIYKDTDADLAATYAERIWIELEAVANFKNGQGEYSWHPQHYLDTAELAYPVAICYDWLYDYWTETNNNINTEGKGYDYSRITDLGLEANRLTIMEESMYWMALCTSNVLEGDASDAYADASYNLAGSGNNWNGVCNGGLMAAALALAGVDRYTEDITYYIEQGIVAVENGMWVYAPDGGYEEGPGYWAYGSTYVHVLASALDSACGTNYGIYNAPGFAKSVYFTTYIGTKNVGWGFHDGGSGFGDTSIAAWFALKASDGTANAIRHRAIENGWASVSMYDIMYYSPHINAANITLELDAQYSLDSIQTFRSSWDADDSIFVGLHGGDNAASHGDLDIGNFIIYVDGVRMISDLGSENYNPVGYFGSYRWSYYRKRAEGQNTLVMLPTGGSWAGSLGIPALAEGGESGNKEAGTDLPTPDQNATAISKTLRYESGVSSALAVIDMSVAYDQMNDGGKRGLYFTDNRSTVIIQDEATFTEAMDIWWFAHTEGVITVLEGGKSAIIFKDGVTLYAEIVTNNMSADVSFTKMAADPLDENYYDSVDEEGNPVDGTRFDGNEEYYKNTTEKSREGYSKLCVTATNVTSLELAVVFKVVNDQSFVPEIGTTYVWTDIDEWTAE